MNNDIDFGYFASLGGTRCTSEAAAVIPPACRPALPGPILRPRHHHSFRGSFSTGSTPIFASKYAFYSIFRALQENHLLASKFAKLCKISRNFANKLRIVFGNFQRNCKIWKNWQKIADFYQNFAKSCRFWKMLKNAMQKIVKILLKFDKHLTKIWQKQSWSGRTRRYSRWAQRNRGTRRGSDSPVGLITIVSKRQTLTSAIESMQTAVKKDCNAQNSNKLNVQNSTNLILNGRITLWLHSRTNRHYHRW